MMSIADKTDTTPVADIPKDSVEPSPGCEAKYIVHEDFAGVFPISPEQYAELKEDIRANGVRDKLIVWNEQNMLLDGHTRDKICKELGITIDQSLIHRMSFDSEEQAKAWMLHNQFSRRNMTPYQRIVAALQFKKFYAKLGKANQGAAGKSLSQNFGKVNTDSELAKLAGSNPETVRQVRKILGEATQKELRALYNMETTIHKVYRKYFPPSKGTPKVPEDSTDSSSSPPDQQGNIADSAPEQPTLAMEEPSNDPTPVLLDTEAIECVELSSPSTDIQEQTLDLIEKEIDVAIATLESIADR